MVSQENDDDDDYDSASDSDFNDAELSSSSAGEDSDEAGGTVPPGHKRKNKTTDADGDVEMASGDEGIVAQAQKIKKKKKKGKGKGKGKVRGKGKAGIGHEEPEEADEEDEDDNAPVGVRVRLRSGRGGIEVRKPTLPTTSTATVDIDSIWARMNNPQVSQPAPPQSIPITEEDPEGDPGAAAASKTVADETPRATITTPHKPTLQTPEATVTIPHTYTFAGEIHTSTKSVPISSPAAIAYLASQKEKKQYQTGESSTQSKRQEGKGTSTAEETTAKAPPLRRPLARKGLLQPNHDHHVNTRGPLIPRSDLPVSIGGTSHYNSSGELVPSTSTPITAPKASLAPGTGNVQKRTSAATVARAAGGEKLNTVEKSKLDWEAEVERQGLREELQKAEKSGESYLGRVEFLKRVEGGEEERARVARLKRAGLA